MNPPAHWTTVTVGDVFTVQLGKMLSEKAKGGTAPFPYLGNKHVQWGRFDLSDLPTMDFSAAEREKFSLKDGDLLVCEGGEVGRAAIWRGQARDCYYQKALHRLRPKSGSILPEYMYRFLQVAASRDMFSGLTSQTSIAHLTKEKLETLELPLPPLPEQKRIAAILDKADNLRKKRQEAIRLTEELLRSAFLEMFGDPVTNPKGWPVKKLGDHIANIEAGWSATGEPRLPNDDEDAVLKISAVTSGAFLPDECKAVPVHSRDVPRPRRGDLLMSRANTRELVAATCLVEEDAPRRFLPDKLWRLNFGPTMRAEYFRYLLWDHTIRANLTRSATGTSGSMLNVSMAKLMAYEVISPPFALQAKFAAFVWKAYDNRRNLGAAHRFALHLGEALTQRAFSTGL